jgi:hypothetical protein
MTPDTSITINFRARDELNNLGMGTAKYYIYDNRGPDTSTAVIPYDGEVIHTNQTPVQRSAGVDTGIGVEYYNVNIYSDIS